MALKQFITVAGAAVFGAFVSMLLTLPLKWTREKPEPKHESTKTNDTAAGAPETGLGPQTSLSESPGQAQGSSAEWAIDQVSTASTPVPPAKEAEPPQVVAPDHSAPTHEGTSDPNAAMSDPGADTKAG